MLLFGYFLSCAALFIVVLSLLACNALGFRKKNKLLLFFLLINSFIFAKHIYKGVAPEYATFEAVGIINAVERQNDTYYISMTLQGSNYIGYFMVDEDFYRHSSNFMNNKSTVKISGSNFYKKPWSFKSRYVVKDMEEL